MVSWPIISVLLSVGNLLGDVAADHEPGTGDSEHDRVGHQQQGGDGRGQELRPWHALANAAAAPPGNQRG